MDADTLAGIIGGAIGSVLGLIGGIVGTYFSIKNTNSPRERRYMIRWAVGCWVGLGIFLGLMIALPNPYRMLLWAPYGIALPLAIRSCNKGVAKIRAEEETRNT